MKALFLTLLLLCSNAFAALTDVKFGRYQIADSQWNVNACLNTTTCQIYSKNPGVAYKIPWSNGQVVWATGDYVKFDLSGNGSFPYTAKQYDSAGNVKSTLGTGKIVNMGPDYFFFVGSDNNTGQLFSGSSGMANTSGVSWTGTLNPTIAQANGYADASYSTTPLAAGQTAGPPPPNPTKIYRQGIVSGAGVYIVNVWATSNNSPGSEQAPNAFDNNSGTKYLNFDKYNAGVTVQLNSGRVVTGFTITTANDFSGRDPTKYRLYGSNDGITWTLIQAGDLTLPDARYTESGVINITNTTPYAYYYIMFPSTKSGDGCGLNCDSMQVGGIAYVYDSNSTVTSTATSSSGSTPTDPVQSGMVNGNGSTGPTVEGGTITQTNSSTGQTITSGGSSTAGFTGTQQTSVTTWTSTPQSSKNYLYIEQISGAFNTVNITQSGTKNTINLGLAGTGSNTVNLNQTGSAYLNSLVQGNNNAFTSTQTNTSGANYQETKIIGNTNAVITSQTGNASQLMFNTINGNNNTVTATQTGNAQHYLETKLTGNGNSVLSDQFGNTSNKANVDLTNGGGPATLDLQQTGGKNFTIIQTCTNPAGCNTTVRQ